MPVSESVIRRMTRLAAEHGAINLAQGFTDEPPPYAMVWGAIAGLLGGSDAGIQRLERAAVTDPAGDGGHDAPVLLREALRDLQGRRDELNQYSYPFGLPELRRAIAAYTARWGGFEPDPETETTVVLGSTEGLAAVLAAAGRRGDGLVVIEPFHEMYPAQAAVFGLAPRYVRLRESPDEAAWRLDPDELRRAAAGARLLILNSPHNPTGKVFDTGELETIAEVARTEDLIVVTDEIYEHIVFDGARHRSIATLPGMRERTVVVNSISKTANATGWRVGWVLAPPHLTPRIRAVHDTLVIQAPTPLQRAAVELLALPDAFFRGLAHAYAGKRALLGDALRAAGFHISEPRGAYYFFADYRGVPEVGQLEPMAAALHLIEHTGVAAVPGDNFYAGGDAGVHYMRFAFCRSRDALGAASGRLRELAGRPAGADGVTSSNRSPQ
ncbi:MAG: aminotransferase class I/II-fold pyridoxal phosphate-dependent enzyme [Acidobacteria bacterium]|nr:aminotransferase class I/II-fold pyridoxal phosphate-dependent enzyme [Acidobacteriota bacterium]MYI74543.1 aminotransferase class I/II-fold pyridoxal phosphate-dependent enzyme [Acidobacteriota bacterium]